MNSAKLGAKKDRQSTSRTRIMQRIHNLGAHNIPTKHKNTYNGHGARRPPHRPKTGKQEYKTHANEQPPEGTPVPPNDPTTAKGPEGPSQQPNRPRPRGAQHPDQTQAYEQRSWGTQAPHRPNRPKTGKQANKKHAYVQPPEGRQAPRTNPTTAKGPAGPPQHPNRQQTGKTKPKQNTHIRTKQPEGPQPPRTNPYIQNIHTKQWPKRSKRPSCATAQATRSARSTRAEAGPPLHILGVVWGDKGSRLWNAAGGARGDVM